MAARRKVRALPVSMAAFGCMLCAIMARAAAATDACDASSPPSPSSPLASLDRDALDIAAYEAVERDDLPAAVDAFGEMVRLDPADAFAHMWRGHLQVRNGQLRGAAASFERAVSTVGERMLAEDAVEGYAASSKRAQLELSLRRVHERLGDAPPSSDGALASEKRTAGRGSADQCTCSAGSVTIELLMAPLASCVTTDTCVLTKGPTQGLPLDPSCAM